FLVPTLMFTILNLIADVQERESCIKNATSDNITAIALGQINDILSSGDKTADSLYQIQMLTPFIYKKEDKKIMQDKISLLKKEIYEGANADKENNNNNGSSSNILLIAGHSFPPYCNKANNECRGVWKASGYDEAVETRVFVRKIHKELSNINVKSDIANVLLLDDKNDVNMNKSFFVEKTLNTPKFNSIKWEKYRYVLEIHFNGSNNSNTKGACIVINSNLPQAMPNKIDEEILDMLEKETGNKRAASNGVYRLTNTSDFSYFYKKNIPITYLETEFYDNKEAMNNFVKKSDLIAKKLASIIKSNYGN
ncbi:MAG: N-acetylmuramoyl-L-alanine amidase, partial [Bacilli bacterium]